MSTRFYTIHREGSFAFRAAPGGKCGPDGTHTYAYSVEITVSGRLKPPQHFIIDNLDIDRYFLSQFRDGRKGQCCELMADEAVTYFLLFMAAKYSHFQVERINVRVSGYKPAWLQAEWRRA